MDLPEHVLENMVDAQNKERAVDSCLRCLFIVPKVPGLQGMLVRSWAAALLVWSCCSQLPQQLLRQLLLMKMDPNPGISTASNVCLDPSLWMHRSLKAALARRSSPAALSWDRQPCSV